MTLPLLSLVLALAASPAARAADSAQDHLAQAEFFARKQWYQDADAELRAALATPAGQASFEVHWLAAQVAWELLDVPRAMEMSDRAAELAPDPQRAEAARALAESYRQGFGMVTIQGPHQGLVSRLQVEPTTPIFDAELKRYVNRLSLDLREKTALPIRVGLPVGVYQVNGQELTVEPGSEHQLDLPMSALGARGLAALQVSRLELGVGVGMQLGARVGNLLPALQGQLAFSQPVGPLIIGLLADGGLTSYTATRGQQPGTILTWDLGLRVGTELVLGGPLAVRPSLLYRYGFVPGLGYACLPQDTAWVCSAEDSVAALDDAPMAVFATGQAHRPGIELALDYREAGRTTALGTGVRLIVDQAIGSVPASSQALLSEAGLSETAATDGSTISWSTSDTSWTATGIQMLGAVSIAF